jgi:hypothetical protein
MVFNTWGEQDMKRRIEIILTTVAALLWFQIGQTQPQFEEEPEDVCKFTDVTSQNKKLETGVATIAGAYKTTPNQLSLTGGPCNWTCGSGRVTPPFIKTFGFLQYNCNSTAGGPGSRLPTGRKTRSEMGLSITDEEYRNETDKIFRSGSSGVGDLMRVPPSLEDASKSGDVKKLTDAVAAIPGATWMIFSSTSVDNDRQGADRVLIRVPDTQKPRRFEQWIQIAINKKTGKLGRNVDFIAVQLLSDATSPINLNPPVVAFRGFSRKPTGFELEGPGTDNSLSKCYSCHSSGLRPIIPAKPGTRAAGGSKAITPVGTMLTGPDLKSQLEEIEKTTMLWAVFGPTGYKAEENGPPLGPKEWIDRENLVTKGLPARPPRGKVSACAAGLKDPARQQAIANHMGCADCHRLLPRDSRKEAHHRGILNAGTSLETIKHKVVENQEAPMPPGVTDPDLDIGLTQTERCVLFECLKAEYAEILKGWLTSDRLMAPGE